jgi:sugar-specific transcriptional regulator TrmB
MLNLSAAGLTATEAKCYGVLLEKPAWKPAELAKSVGETRTNCYKILDNLVAVGLAERFDQDKKLHYRATNPGRLLELAYNARQAREMAEKELNVSTENLLATYYQTHERPGIRYFQGEAGLKEIYLDQINTRQPIYIIRPDYNMDIYDFDYMREIRHLARRAGIQRFAITPDRLKAPKNYLESDPFMLLTRTWMRAGDYTAPVEWVAYGNKLAIMSFGKEAIGMIIESPQVAEAFRQLYKLMDQGLRRMPDYGSLPRKAQYIGSTKEEKL